MNEAFVRVENVSKDYELSVSLLDRLLERRKPQFLSAVGDVSFTIERRQTFALVGESGSGKSTLGKLCVGLLRPTAGDVCLDGVSLFRREHAAQRRRLRRRIQMIFQDPYVSLNPRWRAGSIIAEPIRAFRLVEKSAIGARVGELLALVGLSAADARKYPHQFSGGQRQRIAIARALASEPEFIVCDEPTSSLDVSIQAQILNLMQDLQSSLGLTYLFISHNLAVVRHMADQIGVMYLGQMVERASADDLFQRPRHPYTRMLLDAIPRLNTAALRRPRPVQETPAATERPSGCAFHPRCPHANSRCAVEQPRPVASRQGIVACHGVEEGRL